MLEQELSEKLELKVISQRNKFASLFSMKYIEMIPSLIKYKVEGKSNIDFLKMEVGLMQNYNIVIAKNLFNDWQLCGYTLNNQTITDKTDFFRTINNKLTEKDIKFVTKRTLFPKKMKEITLENLDGNFVVIRNKTLNYVSDVQIINYFTIHLSELMSTRFSLAVQSRVSTFFRGDIGDETINQLVEKVYNGAPYVKSSRGFDPEDNIVTITNDAASKFTEVKREFQNIINELNSMLGVASLGVDKESGVSDVEATSGDAYSNSIANIKLSARNSGFELISKATNGELNIQALYNNQVASEMQKLEFIKDVIE